MKTILRVAGYNVGSCCDWSSPKDADGRLPVSVDKIAAVLASLRADIYGLQEVYFRGPAPDYSEQGKRLTEKIGYPYYADAKGEMSEWGDVISNAVISRCPILRREVINVPAPTESERRPNENNWYEDRMILETEIRLPDGRDVLFITTHFGLNGLERERMVAAVCERLDRAQYPVILLGDFNAPPDSPELAPIRARLTDAARALGNNDFTFASFDPHVTIDYVFVSSSFVPVDFRVPRVVVSDHLPVFAALELLD